MASFISSSFSRMEIIGDTKVNVTNHPVKSLHLARDIAEAKTLNVGYTSLNFPKFPKNDEAFVITNLDSVLARYLLWKRELSMFEPFYAVKCNSDETILHSLAALGVSFDCASKAEIDMVLRMGVSPERIIYANPCKSTAFIEHANANAIRMMTFDCFEELEKIAEHHTNPQLLLRFAVADPTATHPLSGKFGADPIKVAPDLLAHAIKLGIVIVGVSFHVGSGCNNATAFRVGLQHARNLVDAGRKFGHTMEIVDNGGGFPGGQHHTSFEKIASIIRSAIDEYFPENDVRLIAEPGRFFVERPCTLIVNLTARKAVIADNDCARRTMPSTHMHYYVNDGVYGSFNCSVYDHVPKNGRPLFNREGECFQSTVWGPTCDSGDRIESNKQMRLADVGEWLLYEDMGAYTSAASSTFNGFARPTPIHVVSDRVWEILGLEGNNNNKK